MARRSSDRRCWEELDQDCLVNILERVGTESLLLSIPLVCKSWHTASLSPLCYTRLTFPSLIQKGTLLHPWTFHFSSSVDDDQSFDYFTRRFAREFNVDWSRFTVSKFVRLVLNRSRGKTQFLKLPGIVSHYMNAMKEILEHVGHNCKEFEGMEMCHGLVDKELASDIVKLVPRIKYLCLRESEIGGDVLVKLIEGCRELEVLDVRNCVGFSQRNKEIAQLGSHIGKFMKKGSRLSRIRG